jgi:hypothetical protein
VQVHRSIMMLRRLGCPETRRRPEASESSAAIATVAVCSGISCQFTGRLGANAGGEGSGIVRGRVRARARARARVCVEGVFRI